MNKNKSTLAQRLALYVTMTSVFGRSGRNLRHSRMGRITMSAVGYGLAVAGAVLAMIAFVGAVFIPVSTVALIDWEFAALVGAILLIVAVVAHAAGKD